MLHTKLCCWKTSKHVCSNAKHWWNNNQRSQYIKNSISYSLYAKKGSQLSPLWEIPYSKLGLKAGLGSFNKLQLSDCRTYRIAEWSANSYQLLGGWATKCSRPWLAATGLLRWELPPQPVEKSVPLGICVLILAYLCVMRGSLTAQKPSSWPMYGRHSFKLWLMI